MSKRLKIQKCPTNLPSKNAGKADLIEKGKKNKEIIAYADP